MPGSWGRAGIHRVGRSGILLGLLGVGACTTEEHGAALAPVLAGNLVVTVQGLGLNVPAQITVAGPGGFLRTLTGSQTLISIAPGTYTVTAESVTASGHIWAPTSPSQAVTVTSGAEAGVTVHYDVATGGLVITVTGPPGDQGEAALTLVGAGGSLPITSSVQLVGLAPGAYLLVGGPVTLSTEVWEPGLPTGPIVVPASLTPVEVTVPYVLVTGRLTVTVDGLPDGTPAQVSVAGPGGFSRQVEASSTFVGLLPGDYTVSAQPVHVGQDTWLGSPGVQQVSVAAGPTPASAGVTYVTQTGNLNVTVTGLPPGGQGAVMVTGPGGFHQTLTQSQSFPGLVPGAYQVAAAAAMANGHAWAPSPVFQNILVPGGGTGTAAVAYTQSTGTLALTVLGLPGGTSGNVTVTGPGYNQTFGGTATVPGLTPGQYTITAQEVSGGGATWSPAPANQVVAVQAAATAGATVVYSGGPQGPSLNLRIEGLYLTQATQRFDGTVPLIAGRDALLRVFAVANEPNTVQPRVRVRLYQNGALAQTWLINAPGGSVPLAPDESSLAGSWNMVVPAALVQPGLAVLADVDPDGAVAEGNLNDNMFPLTGQPGSVDVRALPTFGIRFVPVRQSVNDSLGNVTAANMESYLTEARRVLPIAGYDADLRDVYVTTAPVLQSNNANGAWGTILNEVLALRVADGSPRYYYGVVRTGYTSGIAGIGFVGSWPRTSLGWDRVASRAWVMAHEVGHNMGRPHAPACGAGSPDPSYPYANGAIGVWGLDVPLLQLKHPATAFDIMGYCSGSFWVSDYNWQLMIAYRQGGPNNAPDGGVAQAVPARRGLLLWGRLTRDGPVLEPAFEVDAPPLLPAPGPHRIELVGADGRSLLSIPFRAEEVADHTDDPEQAFAFVLPLTPELAGRVAELRLVAGGRTVTRRGTVGDPESGRTVRRGRTGLAEVRWNAERYPMALVRDEATGRILSFARHGQVVVPPAGGRYRITFSDGVRSREETAILPQ
jgi:hypothetical protein